MDIENNSILFKISDEEFRLISSLVYKTFGVNLTEQKKALVIGRLSKLLRQKGFKSFKEYYQYVIENTDGAALTELVNKITTNHTFFYREHAHFDYLRQHLLPEIERMQKAKGERTLRIWSAGCSSGEEAYTIAMVVSEYFGGSRSDWDIGILATDISTAMLQKAIAGVYTTDKIRELPEGYQKKYLGYFDKESIIINERIKEMVLFKKLNFLREDFPFKNCFHIIFCRNVMIYFDKVTRDALVEKFYRFTEDGGYLLVGHSESLVKESCPYRYIKPAVYKKTHRGAI